MRLRAESEKYLPVATDKFNLLKVKNVSWPAAIMALPRMGGQKMCDCVPTSQTTLKKWRREGDSNPRYGFWPYNGLANHRLQPLGHLSSLYLQAFTELEVGAG